MKRVITTTFSALAFAALTTFGAPVAPFAPVAALAPSAAHAQVPTPAEVIGFEPGEDYNLADWTQLTEFYQRLAASSDRVVLREIGTTTQGRPMFVLFISSAENVRQLERWRSISERLAGGRIDEAEARRLAREGKSIVWIDSGLHSSEVAHSQHAPVLAHHMATDESEDSRRIRNDVILLLMPGMNPDGHEIVVDWYREQLGTDWETTSPPWLYHEYVGHDINRDWFMLTQAEPRAVARVIFHEWFPQIVFNHHQTAPFPARIFIPPFADPVNPNIPPLVVRGTNIVGEHMAKRFEEKDMQGVVSRMTFTLWWNGGMRTVPAFKNMIGLLSEVGHASATPAFHDPETLPEHFGSGSHRISAREPSIYYANPWRGGWARLGDAVQYHFVASMGALDIASRLREDWLYNKWLMASRAVAAGQEGGPFAYVLPLNDQWDAGEAVELLRVLRRGGVEVHRATAGFRAGGRDFAEGSYVVFAGQAFRNFVVDLMEKQEHPHREQFPGGPPERPYGGLAGWTLPMQMNVNAVRIEEPFTAPVALVDDVAPPPAAVPDNPRFGYLLSPRRNAAAVALNRLLDAGERVHVAEREFRVNDRTWPAGTLVIENRRGTPQRVQAVAQELGLEMAAAASRPDAQLQRLSRPRVGLYKSWVANMDEGWTRYLLHRHEFDVTTLSDQDFRSGDLSRYDVIILPDQSANAILRGHSEGSRPPEYTGGMGDEGVAALRRFVERGGRILAFDGASDFTIEQFGLPVRNAVQGVSGDELFIPGSLIRTRFEPRHPIAWGMPLEGAAFFQGSRAFRPVEQRASGGVDVGPAEVVARYAERDLLMSGWEIGAQQHLAGQAAVVRVPYGRGDLVLIGFRPQFRAWPSGTFKLIFNGLYGATLSSQPGAPVDTPAGVSATSR